ncbi:Catalase family protein [Aspergillus niger]|uniref:Catalase family protein n=1 Tax=Aspergillus niger TaxID=5061 RepID=A0A505I742_ASPNG|nr:Catalase family protein [Aspergillus niger]
MAHSENQTDDLTSSEISPFQTSRELSASLLARCRCLLSEISDFQTLLVETQRNPQIVEVRSLKSNVLSELRTLEKLDAQVQKLPDPTKSDGVDADSGDDDEPTARRLVHTLKSSNLPFYEAVWAIAKNTCRGLVAFGKRFYWGDDNGVSEEKRSGKDKKKSVFVDIIADDGEEWVKVSTLVKLAKDLRNAANATRVRYKHPRLRFVAPRIHEGSCAEIDDLLKIIRSYGIRVDCGEKAYAVAGTQAQEGLSHLLPKPFKHFTSTINVDCTLMLAAVSDLSHYKHITQSPQHHKAINRQIAVEHERPLLPTELWPAMDAYELVCVEEAATRMKEIVNIIGTDTERLRMEILLGEPPFDTYSREDLIKKYQELSDYEIPTHWKIPVKTVEAKSVIASARDTAKLPPVYQKVAENLSDINYSVFLYGWAAGLATISSNRTVVKEIESIIEKHRDGDDGLEGPLIWVCDTARSLIGKEKGRKN